MDLKKLFNMAGVKKEHLQDPEVSHRIFSVLEKAGGMEAVRKQTRRMTSVEKPSTYTRLRSLSSSSLVPTKRQNCLEQDSPHAAKIAAILAHGSSPLCYPPTLSKVPPPMETPPPSSHFPSMRPLPPYLEELSQSFSPADNLSVSHQSKKGSFPPQSLSAKNPMKMPAPLLPVAKSLPSETFGPLPQPVPDYSCADSTTNVVSSSPQSLSFSGSSDKINCIPAYLISSIPCIEPPIKFGDVPSSPPLPLFDKPNSEMITSYDLKECLLNTELVSSAIPPPPPPPLPLSNGSELPFISEVKKNSNPASKVPENMVSSNEPEQQINPAMYLDQIKQGVQLKSVTKTVKVENAECSNLVTALMDVLKRRHKAIQSSDEEDAEEEEWED
ncbi:wiskott-Aldrich syndrome protein-like [Bufo bufo]|uniref:wiskott-Aldrich syndrome protein-like n=1 Tax=Bufo bufo TaxID=8384 RepID=UPI001ABED37D|nr:wiskott-Aldrich syndrome protein-like [Bufo bufo]